MSLWTLIRMYGAAHDGKLPRTLEVLAGGAGQPVHAMYATPDFWNVDGLPATQWTLNWARNLIANAPQPKHG